MWITKFGKQKTIYYIASKLKHMTYNTEVELVTLKNIQDKDMYYVRIKNNNGSEVISIGEKTQNRIKELLNPTEKIKPDHFGSKTNKK